MSDGMKEWLVIVFTVVFGLPLAAIVICSIVGITIDKAADRSEQYDHCLQTANNGLEIRECR